MPQGLPRFQGVPRFLGGDDISELGFPTEAGFVTIERPPLGQTELSQRPSPAAQQTDIQPEFLPDRLEVNGSSVFKPDLGTLDQP